MLFFVIIVFLILDLFPYTIHGLKLDGNKLRSLKVIERLRPENFIRIKAAENEIQLLTEIDFRDFHEIKHVELQKNQIRRIDTGTFQHMRMHLQYLDLSSNAITSLNGSVRSLPQLMELNVRENLIQVTVFFLKLILL